MSHDDLFVQLKNELGNICLDLHLLSSEEFQVINKHVKNTEGNLYDLILKDGHTTEEKLLDGLEAKYGIPIAPLVRPITVGLKNFPYQFCFSHGLVPIGEDANTIEIGVCAPSCLNALKNLNLLTGKKISARFVGVNFVMYALSNFDESTFTFIDRRGKRVEEDTAEPGNGNTEKLAITVDHQKRVEVTPVAPQQRRKSDRKDPIILGGDIVSAVDDILSNAVNTGVSDIHFEIFKDSADIRFRKNGTLFTISEYEKFITENYNAVIARIKILANLDIAERRLPQDGKISFKAQGGAEVDFRISVLPTNLGERIVVRVLNSNSLAVSIDALGFNRSQKEVFLEAITAPQGLVLVTGPTGSGKSTTLYGAINYLNKPDVNILTAEDPVEYTVNGISQVQVREDIGLGFAEALRSFLRQDPEIILVGEIRDAETADIATKAALTGHLVLSTLHTNSAVGAINRLINMGLPAYLVSSALTMVVAQRLVRVNCKHCKTESHQVQEALATAISDIPALTGVNLTHGVGCDECSNTGYSGRMAVHEVLKITPKIQDAINKMASENEILEIALSEGFQPIYEVAIEHIKSGALSLAEYVRVIPHYARSDA